MGRLPTDKPARIARGHVTGRIEEDDTLALLEEFVLLRHATPTTETGSIGSCRRRAR
jgi:hypothetical protein